MDIFAVLSFVGGLALFLYGMHVMGEGLEKQAGGKLKTLLEKLTSNPIKGVCLGALVTAIIQSSSATTVMVVGFVNSGIMQLHQALGIIMGANVGTTITAWMMSLVGLESDNFFISMLKPSSFSPILAAIGVIFIMFSKSSKKKDLGIIFLGFAILMFGMEAMSDAVKPLASNPDFANILILFSNPIFGVCAGALVTAVIQSSSASVGILQILASTGLITYGTAIPIIMGQNIGTTITAMLSSVGANKNARRAALCHLYFNMVGTILFLALFYGLNAVLKFSFITETVSVVDIAVIHTIFNVSCTVVLLPFTKQLEKMAYITIPEDETEEEFQLLDPRLLVTPSVAIDQAKKLTLEMAEIAKSNVHNSLTLLKGYDAATANDVLFLEDKVDMYEDKLGQYLVQLSSKNISDADNKEISAMLHLIGDMERISDHCCNILHSAEEMRDKEMSFSEEAARELDVMLGAVAEVTDLAVQAVQNKDLLAAVSVEPLEEVVDDLRTELKDRHIQRMQKGSCDLTAGFVYVDLLTNLERLSDHCSNVAICVLQSASDDMAAHEYINALKSNADANFAKRYKEYSQKYSL